MTTASKTVAAISTPPGKGGVALIRVSGDEAIKIADRVFRSRSAKTVSELPSRYCSYGSIESEGKIVDDVLLTVYRAPASFTGEDTVEIACHGGMLVSSAVLSALLAAGAIPAPAGEFTKRAYLNGKLTLTEAEAIGDVLSAVTDAQLTLAGNAARGRLSEETEKIYDELCSIAASAYAIVDYPDEDLAEMSVPEMRERLSSILSSLDKLSESYKSAKVITEGIDTVIAGAANTGKSTLYNALAKQELAIVTDIEGTTRDTLSTRITLGDMLLNISDTAGIRESTDTVEKIGIERSLRAIENAALVLCVFDSSRPLGEEDKQVIDTVAGANGKARVALLNKSELGSAIDEEYVRGHFSHVLKISAKSGAGLSELETLITSLFLSDQIDITNDAIIQNARQHACVLSTTNAVRDAIAALDAGYSADIAAVDIESAMQSLGEIDSKSVSEDIVDKIFSKFCVGK